MTESDEETRGLLAVQLAFFQLEKRSKNSILEFKVQLRRLAIAHKEKNAWNYSEAAVNAATNQIRYYRFSFQHFGSTVVYYYTACVTLLALLQLSRKQHRFVSS